MPANLFAAWAGQQPGTEEEVTSVTGVTVLNKYTDSVTESGIVPTTDGADAQVPSAATALFPTWLVTPVADVTQVGLPQKVTSNHCGSHSNPSNPEIATSSAKLDAGDPAARRALFQLRVAYRQKSANRTSAEAEILAFSDCLVQWHQRHGKRPEPGRCAGCGGRFTDNDMLDLGHGVRVHLDPRFSCLTRYGYAWRSAAVAGLHKLGFDPPKDFELLC